MQKTRDRPKQKKKFSLKKSFEGLIQKLKLPKAKAPPKPKAKKLNFKESFNKFKAELKNAFKIKTPGAQKAPKTTKKQNGTKPGKIDPIQAVSGVLTVLVVVAVIGLLSGMGGETKTVIKYIEPDIVEDENDGVNYDTDYTVYFWGVDSLYAAAGVNEGQAVSEPVPPEVVGLYFLGWSDAETDGNMVSFPYTPTQDITLYPVFTDTVVLGFTGLSDSSGDLTWTDDIASADAYSLTENGVYTEVSSPLDNLFPFCEIEEFTDSNGNVFVKYPKCYIKFVTNSDGVVDGFKVSNVQAEEDMFIPDCFLDPSDPEGYTYLDYFALGKYEMSGSSSQGYSKTDSTCLVSITRDQARTAARSYGDSLNYYNGYQLQDYSMTVLYNFLCMTYYKTANIQTVYGGRTSAVSSWISVSVTGTTDPIEGLNGWNTTTDCVKMLGIENPYGNVSKWIDGIVFSGTNAYMFRLPHNYSDSTIGANSFGYSIPSAYSGAFISALKPGTTVASKSYVFPTATSGTADTYAGDMIYTGGSALYVGGRWNNTSVAGLWFLCCSIKGSDSNISTSARLAYRPV